MYLWYVESKNNLMVLNRGNCFVVRALTRVCLAFYSSMLISYETIGVIIYPSLPVNGLNANFKEVWPIWANVYTCIMASPS